MRPEAGVRVIYRLLGHPMRGQAAERPPREIDLSHIPLHELQRISHAGPGSRLLERRHVNAEKAQRLQAFCAESLDLADYRWEFSGRWSDDNADSTPVI